MTPYGLSLLQQAHALVRKAEGHCEQQRERDHLADVFLHLAAAMRAPPADGETKIRQWPRALDSEC